MISEEYTSVDESRWSLWKDTARLIGEHPLLGSGLEYSSRGIYEGAKHLSGTICEPRT